MAHTSQGHSSEKQAVGRGVKHSGSNTLSKSKSCKTMPSLSDKTLRDTMHQSRDTDSDSDTSMPLATSIQKQKKSKAPKGVQFNPSQHIHTVQIPSVSVQNNQTERRIETTARGHVMGVQHTDEFVKEQQSLDSTSDSESDLVHVGNFFAQSLLGTTFISMPNYDVQIIDKNQHKNIKHMMSYTNYFDKSGRKKRPSIC